MSATEAARVDVRRVRTVRVATGRAAEGLLATVVPLPRPVSEPPSAATPLLAPGQRGPAPWPPRQARGAGRARRAAPLRLTRRGRLVLAAVALLTAMVVVLLVAPSAAGMSGHQPARAGYQHMKQVVVLPGQSLWSIAAAADPSADPRIVIQQIIEANALGGASIRAGQLLWVPKP
jgi:LysM domain